MKLVLATHNAHKVDELRRILGDQLAGIELIGYDGPAPVEDGATFEENALIKARAASAHTGLAALADDSGIAVTALGGEPGIHSARYSGTRVDADNVVKLLGAMAGVTDRSARFVCAAAVVIPPPVGSTGPDAPEDAAASYEHVELGVWAGSVLTEPIGDGGFGYDPIFQPEGVSGSAAELTSDRKNSISHRARAFGALMPHVLAQLIR